MVQDFVHQPFLSFEFGVDDFLHFSRNPRNLAKGSRHLFIETIGTNKKPTQVPLDFFEIKTSVLATILFARLTLRKQFCPNGTNSSRCEVALFTIDQVEHTTPRSTVSNPNSPPKINMIASLNKSSGIGSIGSIGSTQEIKTKNNTF